MFFLTRSNCFSGRRCDIKLPALRFNLGLRAICSDVRRATCAGDGDGGVSLDLNSASRAQINYSVAAPAGGNYAARHNSRAGLSRVAIDGDGPALDRKSARAVLGRRRIASIALRFNRSITKEGEQRG